LRDHSHISTDGSEVCAHCGQPLPAVAPNPSYGDRRPRRTGLIVTILLHLLLVLIYLYQPKLKKEKVAASKGGEIVWIAPGKPRPQEQAPKKTPKATPHKSPPEHINVQRLPNTITLPHEKPVEVAKEQPKKETPKEVPQEVDMQAYIEARRRQRGAREPSQATEESDEARGMRNALANIAQANNRGRDDSNDSGGIFSYSNKTFHSLDLKFRGWNPSFKRRWLTQVTVEQGNEPDLETAVVKKMIELIRREKSGDFEWESHRLGKVVTMSARPKDEAELTAFLLKEMFPEYKPPRR
jgi:outer membrane biosynthesis protein TonB